MPNQFAEIERKFLLKSFPTDLPLKEEKAVYQAYLSIDPEVRIRRNVVDGRDATHFLAIKSNGDLVRQEVEIPLPQSTSMPWQRWLYSPSSRRSFVSISSLAD